MPTVLLFLLTTILTTGECAIATSYATECETDPGQRERCLPEGSAKLECEDKSCCFQSGTNPECYRSNKELAGFFRNKAHEDQMGGQMASGGQITLEECARLCMGSASCVGFVYCPPCNDYCWTKGPGNSATTASKFLYYYGKTNVISRDAVPHTVDETNDGAIGIDVLWDLDGSTCVSLWQTYTTLQMAFNIMPDYKNGFSLEIKGHNMTECSLLALVYTSTTCSSNTKAECSVSASSLGNFMCVYDCSCPLACSTVHAHLTKPVWDNQLQQQHVQVCEVDAK